jgi:hypothetical protein
MPRISRSTVQRATLSPSRFNDGGSFGLSRQIVKQPSVA